VNYESEQCEADQCAGSGFATGTGTCTCSPTYGREDHNYLCAKCHARCNKCDSNSLADYSKCTECIGGNLDISPSTDYKFCVAACPTGYNPTGCVAPATTSDAKILSYNFNVPTATFANGGEVAGFTLTATPDG
jgi:hypothetical protein